jgi:hypothetical protein
MELFPLSSVCEWSVKPCFIVAADDQQVVIIFLCFSRSFGKFSRFRVGKILLLIQNASYGDVCDV